MTRQFRGLALAAVPAILLVILAAITFGAAPTITVVVALAAVASGVTLMVRNREEP